MPVVIIRHEVDPIVEHAPSGLKHRRNLPHSVVQTVAARSLVAVQSRSMVAIASNTSETSTWDTLNGFPRLHSRAREAKTNRYAEATGCKPLTRVEIQQVIYDYRIRLESFSRDAIGFEGRSWNVYQFCRVNPTSVVDPLGTIWRRLLEVCVFSGGGYINSEHYPDYFLNCEYDCTTYLQFSHSIGSGWRTTNRLEDYEDERSLPVDPIHCGSCSDLVTPPDPAKLCPKSFQEDGPPVWIPEGNFA